MHRILAMATSGLVVALAVLPVLAAPTLAQVAGVGEDIPLVDENGVTRGTVTLREVTDPFTDAEPSQAPDGMRYVGLIVAFTAADDQTLSADPWSIWLHDSEGWLYSPAYVPRPADQVQPDLQSQDLAPGNRISGFVGYTIPADATLDEIVYERASNVSMTLDDLRGLPGPAPGTDVTYTAPNGGEAVITIDVQDPYTDFDPSYPPQPGTRFVGLQVAYQNTGALPFDAQPSQLYLRTADGSLYWPGYVYRAPDAPIPDLDGQNMSPGNLISGFVGYQIPESSTLQGVDLWPTSDRRVELVDLAGGGAGAVPAETAPPSPAAETSAEPETTPGTAQ